MQEKVEKRKNGRTGRRRKIKALKLQQSCRITFPSTCHLKN